MSADRNNIYKNYNPDILETIANLSNDEVFTPPKLANEILDLLPEEVWSNPNLTFLDPAVKTGIFLREITSRLIDGLADQIPDLQERVNHILTKQVFGIGITELTTLMARRTVYCSMTANSPYSICTEFDDEKGNIIFPDTEHTWGKNGRCEFCGANKNSYGGGGNKENYAYPFIHDNFEKEFGNMKFDVIIGNPPYQLSDGNEGGNSFSATAIYHKFIDTALDLNPKYISMIIPSRWMSGVAKGIPKEWTQKMIADKRIKEIHDYENSGEIFDSVGVIGGICYFLWDDKNDIDTTHYFYGADKSVGKSIGNLDRFNIGSVIRNTKIIPVINKVIEKEGENYFLKGESTFMDIVSPKGFFISDGRFTTNWKDYKLKKDETYSVKYYVSKSTNKVDFGWVKEDDVKRNKEAIKLHKVFIPATYGDPIRYDSVIGFPKYGEPNSISSQTYLTIGYSEKFTKEECLNIISYIKTKFFRFLVRARKNTQDCARGVYQFVPLQDWSKPWTDEELYKKYKLTQEEIDYIEEIVAPMSTSDDLVEANLAHSVPQAYVRRTMRSNYDVDFLIE